jgi:hypothetical protein
MQRLSNLTIFLGRHPATRIAISTFSGQEHFNASGLRDLSNSAISRVDNKQNVRACCTSYSQNSCPKYAEFETVTRREMGIPKDYRGAGSCIPTSILRQNLPGVPLKNYPNREASVRERYSKSYLGTLISCVQVKQTTLFWQCPI